MLFENKTVLITGANGGIGRSLVEAFANSGCDVLAQLRKPNEEFTSFANKIEKDTKKKIMCVYCDLSDEAQIKEMLQTDIVRKKIPVDILVNNAGVAHGGLLQMTSLKTIREVFEVNYFSMVLFTQIVSRIMVRNGGGVIINLASIAGMDLEAGNCAYGASKAAVIAFTKSVAKELANYNIRMNAVAPGLTDTNMAQLMEQKAANAMIENSAMKRLGKPNEIADVVVYLASDHASFINGQVIRVDGGM